VHRHNSGLLEGCGKIRRASESLPQALKRKPIFGDLAARVELGPFPDRRETEFFRSLLEGKNLSAPTSSSRPRTDRR
jgi:hypothetical protein